MNGHDPGALRVLLADEDRAALERLASVLAELGHEVSALAVGVEEAMVRVTEEDPDVSIVVVHNDVDHALRLIGEALSLASGPVLAHMAQPDPDVAAAAAERGVAAVIERATPETVQSAIEIALRRHGDNVALEQRVAKLETALERRALIERAKGILMERHSVGGDDAFALLRAHARANNERVVDVARAVTGGHALLPATRGGS